MKNNKERFLTLVHKHIDKIDKADWLLTDNNETIYDSHLYKNLYQGLGYEKFDEFLTRRGTLLSENDKEYNAMSNLALLDGVELGTDNIAEYGRKYAKMKVKIEKMIELDENVVIKRMHEIAERLHTHVTTQNYGEMVRLAINELKSEIADELKWEKA